VSLPHTGEAQRNRNPLKLLLCAENGAKSDKEVLIVNLNNLTKTECICRATFIRVTFVQIYLAA
jgi:hypothetical protein